ncbi:MAG: glycyl-radical enzyme activating protein [Pirellulaceae bacterium]
MSCIHARLPWRLGTMQSGCIFNIQRFSVHDGPGIRTTVFLKGCPLACAWCHNPEGIAPGPQLLLVETRCVRCGECSRACPHPPANGQAVLSTTNPACDLCGSCVEACGAGAREVAGSDMSVDEVMAVARRDRMFYEDSAGGVTFSGGEPFLQTPFLLGLLHACREEGYHTVVDTSGFCPAEDLLAAAPLTDLFLFDLKLMDDARHRQFTGVSNGRILENLQALAQVDAQIWLRLPLIAGVNDSEQDLATAARFAATVPGVRQVNLLPYHGTGVAKARRSGWVAGGRVWAAPSRAVLERAASYFRQVGLETKIGG